MENMKMKKNDNNEQMVTVFESEYYDAKECAAKGVKAAPSLLQQEQEFGPYEGRNMIVRVAGDEDIPVDELAVEEELLPEHITLLQTAEAAGVFRQGYGMAVVPETNGIVMAGIWETEKHDRVIRLLFKNKNGSYTQPMELDNAAFVISAQADFKLPERPNVFSKDIVAFHKKAMKEIINRLPLGEGIDYIAVLTSLQKYHSSLPLHEFIEEDASVKTIYHDILCYMKNHPKMHHVATKYFRLTSPEMQEIAAGLNMSVKDVCLKLKENNLLYLTGSQRGFQTKVKINSVLGNYYCVLKGFGKQSIPHYEPKVLEDGAEVVHDGTVRMPLNLYQQMFGDSYPSVLSADTKGFPKSKKSKAPMEW